jgi:hypothetical protein
VNVESLPSVTNYFKCSDQLLSLGVDDNLSSRPGFFRFGSDTVCYGKTSAGSLSPTPDADLFDASASIRKNGAGVILPFDPEELIRNLREEWYARNSTQDVRNNPLVRYLYYAVRPWLSLPLRKNLQRLYLRGWERLPFPKWPVDRTVDCLMEQLAIISLKAKGIEEFPFIWFWPDAADACAIMTHDVEERVGKDFCSQLMDFDDSCGVPASFQVVPEERYSVEPEFLDQIRSRGFEVNVQDLNHDGRLFQEKSEFENRAKAINRYGRQYQALGFRSAVLYRNQEWFDRLDFEYDMSVPNVAHLDPQRGGCCTVMPYFVGELLELPVTTTQDHTLFNVMNDFSTNLWERQIQYILSHHGLMSFIVHPDYILSQQAQSSFKRLLSLLAKARDEDNVWVALPRDVNRWWRQRNQMTLAYKDGEWRVEGEGSDRARVAFASLQGDRLVYHLPQRKDLPCEVNSSASAT